MGGDGGCKVLGRKYTRHKEPTTKEKADSAEVAAARASTCRLSNRKLAHPVVCCRLGMLYNKDVLIERLLSKQMPNKFKHIRGLKDVCTLNFTRNPAAGKKGESGAKGSGLGDAGGADGSVSSHLTFFAVSGPSEYICPVTQVEMNGRNKFVAVWGPGTVLSERAMKEISAKDLCDIVGEQFDKSQVVKLNPNETDMHAMKVALEKARLAEKEAKRKRKEAKRRAKELAASGDAGKRKIAPGDAQASSSEPVRKKKKKRRLAAGSVGSGSVSTAFSRQAAAADAKVAANLKKDKVFASLFGTEGKAGVKGGNKQANLFIRVATHRYTT